MSEFEAELSAALRPAAELHEPPCALDLDRARVHGRRLRRRRQGLQAGAAMAATALVAVLVTGSLSGGGGATMVPASPPATSGGETANDPADLPARNEPRGVLATLPHPPVWASYLASAGPRGRRSGRRPLGHRRL